MKSCPFCAEQIQDAAVVCRYCNRDLGPLPVRRAEPLDGHLARFLRGGEIGLGILVVAGVSFLFFGDRLPARLLPEASNAFVDPASAAPAAPPPPLVLAVLDSVFTLPPGEHVDTTVAVADPRPCTLTGRVRGISGGSRDLEVLVLDEDDYQRWHDGLPISPLYESGRSASTTLEVALPGPGRYSLLVSNAFSVFTGKSVEVEEVEVTCGDPSPGY